MSTHRRRVAVVVTARASYARVKTALEAIRDHPRLELRLIVGASALLDRHGALPSILADDGFEVAAQVHLVVEGDHPVAAAKSTGLGILELAPLLDRLDPEVVLTVADRYETLATAVAASLLHLPLAHLQGGEVSGSIDDKVRHGVSKLADLHFVANSAARDRVVAMGEDPATVFVTGCPSIDLAARVLETWDRQTFDPFALAGSSEGGRFDLDDGYLVVMQHPVTDRHERTGDELLETLAAVETLGLPIFWFRPNVDPGSRRAVGALRRRLDGGVTTPVRWVENLPPEDFLRLLLGARCLVGNSSVGVREAAFLGVPVVNLGGRQEGRERGANLVDVAHDRRQITAAIRSQLDRRIAPDPLYGEGRAGQRIAELLAAISLDGVSLDDAPLDDAPLEEVETSPSTTVPPAPTPAGARGR